MIKYILAALVSVALATPALALDRAPATKKEAAQKAAPAKPKNDPKWKNNSMAKKQAECRADPSLPKCKKPAKKADKK